MSVTDEPAATRRARSSARQEVRRNPEDWRAHARIGEIEFERGRIKAARSAYYQAWRLKPDDPGVRAQLAVLGAMLDGRRRRSALLEVEQLIARGDLPVEALPGIVDATVALRVRWLVAVATVAALGLGALTLAHREDAAINPSTWPRAGIGGVAVVLLFLLWLVPLLTRLTPSARRLLPGLPRRDPLLGLEIAGQLLAIGLLLAVPALWAAGLPAAVSTLAVSAFAVTVLTGAVVAGIAVASGGGGWSLVGMLLLPPVTLPLAVVAALITALARLVRRAVRRRR